MMTRALTNNIIFIVQKYIDIYIYIYICYGYKLLLKS